MELPLACIAGMAANLSIGQVFPGSVPELQPFSPERPWQMFGLLFRFPTRFCYRSILALELARFYVKECDP